MIDNKFVKFTTTNRQEVWIDVEQITSIRTIEDRGNKYIRVTLQGGSAHELMWGHLGDLHTILDMET